ncbi:hypothetical protein [Halorubrum sp. CSM-61]|uniref:hypothetical protein n=1 Tax=Halorubrum sp. CSM-61 TaxID=2485838 RepID=UPI000F4CD7C6|nr:hypothetical protein [Halorubrum sp. CSM-61]
MYDIKDIVTAVKNPRKALLELNRIYHRKIRGMTGIKVMEEDWDNLIILDACRYDLFEEVNTIDGELTSVISSDSSTSGFLKHNFADEHFPDTVYIAANPQVQRHEIGSQFHDCIRLWETEWREELDTVPPESVTDAAIEAQNKYPNKRLIIHYVQPHYPFIGETGQDIDHRSVTGDGIIEGGHEVHSVWDLLESGSLEQELVWKAYRENLELALPQVDHLLGELRGKSVVTSDHGNAFGEFGVFGHPGGVYTNSLVKVPWLVTESNSRPKIEGELADQVEQQIASQVTDRLKDLGYAN